MLTAQTPDIDATPLHDSRLLTRSPRRSLACRFTGLPNTYGTTAASEIPSEISVAIYLDTNNASSIAQVVRHLDELVESLGYHGPIEPRIERGSFIRWSRAKFNGTLTSREAKDVFIKVQRALELSYLENQQAEVDSKAAKSVSSLVMSLNDIPNACIRAGSILLVKYSSPQGPVILTRILSPLEIKTLERLPGIQQDPQKVLEYLALAQAESIESEPPDSEP